MRAAGEINTHAGYKIDTVGCTCNGCSEIEGDQSVSTQITVNCHGRYSHTCSAASIAASQLLLWSCRMPGPGLRKPTRSCTTECHHAGGQMAAPNATGSFVTRTRSSTGCATRRPQRDATPSLRHAFRNLSHHVGHGASGPAYIPSTQV